MPGSREPGQRSQQSRKCLVRQKPCQVARPQGQGRGWRGGQNSKPKRRWEGARRWSVRDTSEGGQQGAGGTKGFTGLGHQLLLRCLAPSFLIFKGTKALSRAYPGTPSVMLCPCARVGAMTLRRLSVAARAKPEVTEQREVLLLHLPAEYLDFIPLSSSHPQYRCTLS